MYNIPVAICDFFLNIARRHSGKSNRQIVMFVAIIVIYTLMGSSFTTSLLTHGLFLLLVTMYVTPWENNKEQ